jgi:hypothetical protein
MNCVRKVDGGKARSCQVSQLRSRNAGILLRAGQRAEKSRQVDVPLHVLKLSRKEHT